MRGKWHYKRLWTLSPSDECKEAIAERWSGANAVTKVTSQGISPVAATCDY